jgi:hypothetical protein
MEERAMDKQLESRIKKIERGRRFHEIALIALTALLVLLVLALFFIPTPVEIRSQRFAIVDEQGTVRGVLESNDDLGSRLALMDEEGRSRVSLHASDPIVGHSRFSMHSPRGGDLLVLSAGSGGSDITVASATGGLTTRLAVEGSEYAGLTMHDGTMSLATVILAITPSGERALIFANREQQAGAFVGLRADGKPLLSLFTDEASAEYTVE